MNSLTPLKVPRQLLVKKRKGSDSSVGEVEGVAGDAGNQTDHEKAVVKKTASLIEVSFDDSRSQEYGTRFTAKSPPCSICP